VVYEWMHAKDVDGWNYARGAGLNGTAGVDCALVSYRTYVESPTVFGRLLRNL
jgi:hypothetical protein